jgi:uncharacterized membrane protein
MSDWLEHSVQLEINAPVNFVWDVWSNLELMPQWMQWINSVKISPDDPDVSTWNLRMGIWEFNWKSRTTKAIPLQLIQWESVDGLSNQGAVRFYQRPNSTIVKMSISYTIPGTIGKIMDNLFVGRLVESMLHDGLEKFRRVVERTYASQVVTK